MAFDLDVLGDLPGEEEVAHLFLGGRAPRCDRQRRGIDRDGVPVLHQEAARYLLPQDPRCPRIGKVPGKEESEVRLAGEDRPDVLVRVWRDDHLGEHLGDGFHDLALERAVHRDDAAEGADGSQARALACASARVAPVPTPQGLACLTITQAASPNSATSS
jgi:hypothetical protein